MNGGANTVRVKEMELENAALEVASKVWLDGAEDRYRKIRNQNRRLHRKCAKLRMALSWTQLMLAAWRLFAIHK